MDTFCLIFKSIGDYILPIIGLCLALGAVSPALEKWFKKREGEVKKDSRMRKTLGISLAAFCITLIAATIRIQCRGASKAGQVL